MIIIYGEKNQGHQLESSSDFHSVMGDNWLFDFHSIMGEKQATVMAEFLEISHTASETPLRITENHFLFAKKGDAEPVMMLAGLVSAGDSLLVRVDKVLVPSEVTSISTVTDVGLYAPVTFSGRLIVNDVLVSSYATLPSMKRMLPAFEQSPLLPWETLAHALTSPVRYFYALNLDTLFPNIDWCSYAPPMSVCGPDADTNPAVAGLVQLFDASVGRALLHVVSV